MVGSASAPLSSPRVLQPRHNNFGALRLLLAGLVILAHSPDLTMGDGHEFLARLVGTVTFGGFAVNGFFLISGFLIVKSWTSDPRLLAFLGKRALRIWPGFAVATVLSVLAVSSLAMSGAHAAHQSLLTLKDVALLHEPSAAGTVLFRHFPLINGATWTIKWEFGCYLLVAACGVAGLTKSRWPWIALFALAAISMVWNDAHGQLGVVSLRVQGPRFLSFFSLGALFYLYREKIAYRRDAALAAAGLMFVAMLFKPTSEIGMAVFGGYLLFSAAFAHAPLLAPIGTKNDVSYGLYLYAWPIQQFLFFFVPSLGLGGHIVASFALSAGAGFLSWRFVESPALRLARRGPKPSVPAETKASGKTWSTVQVATVSLEATGSRESDSPTVSSNGAA